MQEGTLKRAGLLFSFIIVIATAIKVFMLIA